MDVKNGFRRRFETRLKKIKKLKTGIDKSSHRCELLHMERQKKFTAAEILSLLTGRKFTPKMLLSAFGDFEFVNYRHLRTRVEKGYIQQFKPAPGQGAGATYDIKNALVYGISVFLENEKYDIDISAEVARYAVYKCFYMKNNLWYVSFYGQNGGIVATCLNSFSGEIEIKETKERLEKQINTVLPDFIVLNPLPNVYFKINKFQYDDIYLKIKGIVSIRVSSLTKIIDNVVSRLNISENEIENLYMNSLKSAN